MSSAAGVQTTADQAHDFSSHAVALQTIAHELRQPLSAIESIAYYLNLVLPKEHHRAREEASRLQHLIQQSNWILTCGLQLVNTAPLAPQPVDLEELITQTAATRSCHHGPRLDLQLAGSLPPVRLDPGRGRALMENLVSLFECLSPDRPFRLATSQTPEGVCLTFAAAVPGYRSETSLGPGCDLSLASARQVVETHGGTCDLKVDPASGIVLTVVLP
ncbi:MAG: HAMP domain-containing histidine kinase [Bryobacterales bacterium]|nr:HAMP domain-containing histidine kinase [Bryobacterales bacterium]